jgi:hypothetical protein
MSSDLRSDSLLGDQDQFNPVGILWKPAPSTTLRVRPCDPEATLITDQTLDPPRLPGSISSSTISTVPAPGGTAPSITSSEDVFAGAGIRGDLEILFIPTPRTRWPREEAKENVARLYVFVTPQPQRRGPRQ